MMTRLSILIYLAFALTSPWAHAQLAPATPNTSAITNAPANALTLRLSAKLTPDGPSIEKDLAWYVFSTDQTNENLAPKATETGGSTTVQLPAGSYLVYAGYGRAGLTKRVELARNGQAEEFVLNAGGLKLNASTVGGSIRAKDLRFSIYEAKRGPKGRRKLIAMNIRPDRIVRLNEGTYHVLSKFGTINATVRADLQVKAGQVTSAQLQHRGAEVSLRLVSRSGGDPIANTSWTVFTADGEPVFTSKSVAPTLILAEGVYEAAAQNGNRSFKSTFTVQPGRNIRVEVRRAG